MAGSAQNGADLPSRGSRPIPTIRTSLDSAGNKQQLEALLRKLGIQTESPGKEPKAGGFPFELVLKDGKTVRLDLPSPGFISNLDTREIGVAIIDPLGYARRAWGLARHVEYFDGKVNLLNGPLSELLGCSASGEPATIYLDGLRFFAAGIRNPPNRGEIGDVFVLVVNASEEQVAKENAGRSSRFADALKRVGRVLAANQSVERICQAAGHEIASVTDLAAVAIWTVANESGFGLSATVGITRRGQSAIGMIFPETESSCVPELVGAYRRPCFIRDVNEHMMTAALEAKFCYLTPRGLYVLPLIVGNRLLGIIELIGKADDAAFEDHRELFDTFAEHFALALNAALLYETAEMRASKDALTGIANHRTLQEFLQRRIAEARRNDHPVGLMMMDVDHFRAFNEEEGHDAGDAVLQQVAEALTAAVRPYDLAARYGGEEFTVIMPGSGRQNLLEVAERIRARVENQPFTSSTGRVRHITLTIGCAVFPDCAEEPKELLKAADRALFEGKRMGRNRVVYDEGDANQQERARTRHRLDATKLVYHEMLPVATAMLENLRDEIEFLSLRLPLSNTQVDILEALVLVAPTYREAQAKADDERIQLFDTAPESRVLLPSLHALNERYDGRGTLGIEGNKIPLLARVLHVLLALEEQAGEPLISDPGRFDPEIVSIMGEQRSAA